VVGVLGPFPFPAAEPLHDGSGAHEGLSVPRLLARDFDASALDLSGRQPQLLSLEPTPIRVIARARANEVSSRSRRIPAQRVSGAPRRATEARRTRGRPPDRALRRGRPVLPPGEREREREREREEDPPYLRRDFLFASLHGTVGHGGPPPPVPRNGGPEAPAEPGRRRRRRLERAQSRHRRSGPPCGAACSVPGGGSAPVRRSRATRVPSQLIAQRKVRANPPNLARTRPSATGHHVRDGTRPEGRSARVCGDMGGGPSISPHKRSPAPLTAARFPLA
jgi:hypothetical protein